MVVKCGKGGVKVSQGTKFEDVLGACKDGWNMPIALTARPIRRRMGTTAKTIPQRNVTFPIALEMAKDAGNGYTPGIEYTPGRFRIMFYPLGKLTETDG